ncbi:hypothetical protein JJD84_11455 [Pseudomonas fluorescens]|nr:hypothetical protein [Pseudomonas fluorescens]
MTEINHNKILAEAAARHLRETGAVNYTGAVFIITFDNSGEQIQVLVTTQKVGAPTPHDFRVKAERQRDDLHKCLAAAREWLGDGKFADGLSRSYWRPAYSALVDHIDETLAANHQVAEA